jgi:hypothetical protein
MNSVETRMLFKKRFINILNGCSELKESRLNNLLHDLERTFNIKDLLSTKKHNADEQLTIGLYFNVLEEMRNPLEGGEKNVITNGHIITNCNRKGSDSVVFNARKENFS